MARVLRAARVFDGERALEGPHQVRVEEGRIVEVAPARREDRESAVDYGDATILPGLVDAHVHLAFDASPDINALVENDTPAAATLRAVQSARRQLAAGVTAVRDLGSPAGILLDLVALAGTELLPPVPRIQAAGEVLTITGGHGHFMGMEVDGPDAFRRAARAQIKHGAEVLKVVATGGVITRQGTPGAAAATTEELRAVVEEAHQAGLRVAAHAHGAEGIKRALRAGVDTIEHASYLDEEAVELFVEREAWLVSTLIASERLMPHLEDPEMPPHVREKIRDHTHREAASLELAISSGVRVAAGTDGGTGYNPHGGLPEQAKLLERHSMSREAALAAATAGSARAIGLDAGRIASGYPADLLVVAGDPLANLNALERVRAVYLSGRLVEGEEPAA
jgi:imidazolonepropionase-like amidohydrolase